MIWRVITFQWLIKLLMWSNIKTKNLWGSVFISIMALAAPTLLVRVALLQMLGAFVMVRTGILDRVQAKDRVIPFPLWTGILASFRQQLCSMLKLHVSAQNINPKMVSQHKYTPFGIFLSVAPSLFLVLFSFFFHCWFFNYHIVFHVEKVTIK